MSLIFSALSEMEKQAKDGLSAHTPTSSAQQYSSERKIWPLLLGAIVVLALVAFLTVKLLDSFRGAPAPVNAQPSNVAVPAVPATMAVAVTPASESKPELAPYMQAAPVQENYPASVNALPATVAQNVLAMPPAPLPVAAPAYVPQSPAPAPAPAMVIENVASAASNASVPGDSVIQASPIEATPVAEAPRPARVEPDKSYLDKATFKIGRQPDSPKEQDVNQLVSAFSNEMASGNYTVARGYLDKLQTRLPAQSLTSLRMQAWYAVETSDDSSARDLYTRILDRVPDDQNAGVNIALIDWRANRYSTALARIDRLHQLYPDSALVSQNWRLMHDQRQ